MRPFLLLLLCAPVITGAGCAARAKPAPLATPAVKTAVARTGTLSPRITLSGIIAPHQNVALTSSLSEPAAAVYVHEGDRVYAGEVLAQLDVSDLEANLKSAELGAEQAKAHIAQTDYQGRLAIDQGGSGLSQAKASLAQAQEKLRLDSLTQQRDRQLFARGYVAQNQIDSDATLVQNDRAAVVSAQAGVQSAQANVGANGASMSAPGLQSANAAEARAAYASSVAQAQQLQVQIAKGTIRSPVDGMVINRNLNPGEYPGTRQIFTVQELSTVYAMLNASSDQVLRVRAGSPAIVHAGNLNERTMPGVVEAVLGQAQPGSTNFMVKVRVPNSQYALLAGMVVSADLALPAVSGTVIPAAAFADDTHQSVRVAGSDGAVRLVSVRDVGGNGVQSVVQGVRPGERVIVGSE